MAGASMFIRKVVLEETLNPAFAGNALERFAGDPLTQPSPPEGGEGFIALP
jgi:hypothetical protein